jgi:hypothetical protein
MSVVGPTYKTIGQVCEAVICRVSALAGIALSTKFIGRFLYDTKQLIRLSPMASFHWRGCRYFISWIWQLRMLRKSCRYMQVYMRVYAGIYAGICRWWFFAMLQTAKLQVYKGCCCKLHQFLCNVTTCSRIFRQNRVSLRWSWQNISYKRITGFVLIHSSWQSNSAQVRSFNLWLFLALPGITYTQYCDVTCVRCSRSRSSATRHAWLSDMHDCQTVRQGAYV